MTFSLPKKTTYQKNIFLKQAEKVLIAQQQMQNLNHNILNFILKENNTYSQFIHYPKQDRIDHQTGAQYFYHCHREDKNSEEHGHFHCFLRYQAIPKSIKPAKLIDWDKYINNPMTHIIAIAMNTYGQPIRLFTVNRWVSKEIWYEAKEMERIHKRFQMRLNDDNWKILDTWIEGLIQLFKPQIYWLWQTRDKQIQELKSHKTNNIYEDNSLEELSSFNINLTEQIKWAMS